MELAKKQEHGHHIAVAVSAATVMSIGRGTSSNYKIDKESLISRLNRRKNNQRVESKEGQLVKIKEIN